MSQIAQFNLTAAQEAYSTAGVYALRNFRLTEDGVFQNDRGWEPLKHWPIENDHVYPVKAFSPCRFLSVYKRHSGAECYYLYERGGALGWEYGVGESTATRYALTDDLTRHLPGPTDIGTQLINMGEYAVIANGYDKPFKFWGKSDELCTDFSWRLRPAAPTVYPITPLYDLPGDTLAGDTQATAVRLGFVDAGGDPTFAVNDYLGITQSTEASTTVAYRYWYSYVSDTGSESPLSEPTLLSFQIGTTTTRGQFVAFINIPEGPNNTKAVNLYRSHRIEEQNPSSDVEGQAYLVARIMSNNACTYSDFFPDSMNTLLAPVADERGLVNPIIPVSNFNIGTLWDQRLWLSGGTDYSSSVVYSDVNQPETIRALNYFPYQQGGRVTALVPYAGRLVVFRTQGIDFITRNEDGSYRSTSLSTDIGCPATNTIKSIPGAGLVFLGRDGFYAITQDKEQVFQVTKISQAINDIMDRLTAYALPRATAVYNEIEKEYWCHFPIDGWEENVIGAVLHTNGTWTLRGLDDTEYDKRQWMFTCLDFDGQYTIIGATPYDSELGPENDPSLPDGTWHNLGLMVWSARPHWGVTYTDLAADPGGGYTTSLDTTDQGNSIIETNWLVLDTTAKKRVNYLELLCQGTGYGTITVEYAVDYRLPYTDAGDASPVHSSYIGSVDEDVVYDASTSATTGQWDQSVINDYRLLRLRYDIGSENVSAVKFKITTSDLFAVRGFLVGFTPRGSPAINQQSKARSA